MCPTCGAARPATPAAPAATLSPWPSGNDPTLLPQVQGWSWGAFFLNWIWAFAHRLNAWGAGLLIVGFLSGLFPPLGLLVFAGNIYLGIKGNELAWQQRPFRSVEQFKATERVWMIWGLVLVGGVFVLGLLVAMLVPVFALAYRRAHGMP